MLAAVRLDERSSAACALSSWRGRLCVAWTGTDRRVTLLTLGPDWSGEPVRLDQAKSDQAPALCGHAAASCWPGRDGRLNLGRVEAG
jgi:hypothetical protein